MTSIASPRPPSITSSPTSSRNGSPAPHPKGRANRAALRDYYGLKASAPTDATSQTDSTQDESEVVQISELDNDDFDASAYVQQVLRGENLEGVLKTEARLLSDIRSLDGEKKALVYDNYSKLIAATDTILTMRSNMTPLAPTTSSLNPAVGHITQTTESIARSTKDSGIKQQNSAVNTKRKQIRKQQETVRWVVDSPRRLEKLLHSGKRDDAQRDWNEVKGLLKQWAAIKGTQEVREECEKLMADTA